VEAAGEASAVEIGGLGRVVQGGPVGVRRWLIPYFGVLFFALHMVAAFSRGNAVDDPGVGWHLRTGRLMLETGTLPRTDPFSYTAEGKPWLNYYWGFQVVSAELDRLGGLPLFGVVWMLVYAAIPLVLYKNMVRSGASPLAALLVLPAAHLVLLSHALARPHALTYLFFALLVGRLADVETGRRDLRALWWLPLLMMVWVNVHGGFVAGLAAVGVVTIAVALGPLAKGETPPWRLAGAFAAMLAVMALATLVNPYGANLHLQAVEHVSQASTARFAEFRSPDFRGGGSAVGAFELFILAVIALGTTGLATPTWGTTALLVATLHLALASVRNMNLFAIVAAPVVADGLTRLLARVLPRLHARWQAIGEAQERSAPWLGQVALVSVVCVALALSGRVPMRRSLLGVRLSTGAAAWLDANAERAGHIFNTDGLGGVLIYQFWPRVKVFVDDRTPVFGEAFMGDYFTIFDAAPGWEALLDRWQVRTAIMAKDARIATVLRAAPGWTVAYEDDQNVICARAGAP
jgi:hypothetical protein